MTHDRNRRDRGANAMASAANARTNMRCKASSAPPRRRRPANYKDEIVPLTTKMKKLDKATRRRKHGRGHGRSTTNAIVPTPPWRGWRRSSRCIWAASRWRKANTSPPAMPRNSPTARRACVVMSDGLAAQKRPEAAGHLPRLRGGRRRAGGNGHRPGAGGAAPAASATA